MSKAQEEGLCFYRFWANASRVLQQCNRARPTCSNCVDRDVPCEYPATQPVLPRALQLERFASALKRSGALTNLFYTLPYHEALDLFNLLRETPRSDMLTLMEGVSDFDTPTTATPAADSHTDNPPHSAPALPDVPYIGSLLPPAAKPLHVELMVRHPIAYPVLMPVKASSRPFGKLLVPQRLHAVHNAESMYQQLLLRAQGDEISAPPGPVLHGGSSAVGTGTGMTQVRQEWLEQLDRVTISSWTLVPIPNRAAVQAIAFYLSNDYPVLPLFNVDLFLRDLALHQPYFCSPFLVSALLAWAFQAYTAVVPSSASWSSALFAEAEARWAQHHSREAITLCSVSALQLLSMTAVTQGRSDAALDYLTTGLDLAKAMGLINVPAGEQTADMWLQDYSDWKRAASYTAWGVFNWASIFTLRYHKTTVDFPPTIAMPGEIDAAIAMEVDTAACLPIEVELFQASCRLWSLFLVISTQYYGAGRDDFFGRGTPLEFALDLYRQLLAWADTLPLSLVRRPESGHGVFLLHAYFHAIVSDLVRPFIHIREKLPPLLNPFNSECASPEAIYSASTQQMKRLLLSYCLAFPLETPSFLWHTCVIYVANATIHEVRDKEDNDPEELSFFLSLCLTGLEDLFASYKVFGPTTKGLLGMAVRQGVVERDEVRRICRELGAIGQRYAVDAQDDAPMVEMAKWIIDLDLAMTDPVGAQAGYLAAQFERLNLDCSEET